MLTFGFSTNIDLMSWTIGLALAAKLVATATLLAVDKSARDRPGWGSTLWWITKLTPVIAVPCLIGVAFIENDRGLLWLSTALALFVAIAVPLKVQQRALRITGTSS